MIAFNIQQVFNFLTEYGYVYTLRHAKRAIGITVATHNRIPACHVVVDRIVHARVPQDLEQYVKHSSFETVEEWLKAASPNADTLYYVRIIP